MMLGRRLFLLGTGAALAVIKAPVLVGFNTSKVRLSDLGGKTRLLRDFSISLDGEDRYYHVALCRAIDSYPLFSIHMNGRGSYRWVARPKYEIVVPPMTTLNWTVDPDPLPLKGAAVGMISTTPEGRDFFEQLTWGKGRPRMSDPIWVTPE